MKIIQRIRAEQVLKEENLDLPIKILHSHAHKMYTKVGDREFKLVFPKYMLNYDCTKSVNMLFIGLLTKKRRTFIDNDKFKGATIIDSDRGRKDYIKERDESYNNLMAKARFGLCPNGDFIWTYRFFEAVIFKSIPIIQEPCELYEGYKYYTINDEFIYDEDIVSHNLEKVKREMFW